MANVWELVKATGKAITTQTAPTTANAWDKLKMSGRVRNSVSGGTNIGTVSVLEERHPGITAALAENAQREADERRAERAAIENAATFGHLGAQPTTREMQQRTATSTTRNRLNELERQRAQLDHDIHWDTKANYYTQAGRKAQLEAVEKEQQQLNYYAKALEEQKQQEAYEKLRYTPVYGLYANAEPKTAEDDRSDLQKLGDLYVQGQTGVNLAEQRQKNAEPSEYMTEAEKQTFNFLLNASGENAAERYRESLSDTLNQRAGAETAEKIQSIKNDVLRGAATGAYGAVSGLDRFVSGAAQLASKEPIETSPTQYGASEVRKDLGTVGKIGFDLANTVGYMLPGTLVSIATAGAGAPAALAQAAGSTAIGLSSAGNAFTDAKRQGYSDSQAKAYGLLVGASESALQYALGGIGKLGGKLTGKMSGAVLQKLGKMEKGFVNFIVRHGSSAISEAGEEGLQGILEPVFRNMVLNEDLSIDWGEVAYGALLGGLMGGVMGGDTNTQNNVTPNTESVIKTPKNVTQGAETVNAEVNTPAGAETAQRAENKADSNIEKYIAEYDELLQEYNERKDKALESPETISEQEYYDIIAMGNRLNTLGAVINAAKTKTAPTEGAENDTLLLPEVTENAIKNGLPLRKDGAVYKIVEIPQTKIDEISAYVDTMTSADTRKKFKQIIKDLFMGNTYTNANTVAKNLAYQIKVGSKGLGEIIARQPVNSELLAMLEQLDEVVENAKYMASEPTSHPERRGIERTDIFHTDVMLGENPAVAKMRVNVGKDGNNLYFMTNEKTDSNIRQPQAGESRQSGIGEVPSANVNVSQQGVDVNRATEMPIKAQKYLERKQNGFVRKLGDTLSVPRYARRDYLKPIVQEITNEYMQTGKVNDSSVNELFERAYDEGIKVDSEFYDAYKWLKDRLRDTAVTLTDADKSNIADWDAFRKSAFNTLKITNDGVPVDTAYQQLGEAAPGLFPAEITRPADQLVHMYEVARSISKVERTLDAYYGSNAEDFRKWAKNDFTANINDMLGELAVIKRYTEERNTAKAPDAEITEESVRSAYKGMKDSRRELDKVKARNLLTQHDEVQLGRLLRGELELQNLNARNENVKGITEVFTAQQEYEKYAAEIRRYNQQRKENLRKTAEGYLATANDWKDKKAGISYSVNTMERNVRDIVKDAKLADSIIAEYFAPIHDAQAEATRTKNDYRNRVRALNLSRKVAEGNTISEAAAVQLLGEAEDNIKVLEESRGKIEQRDGKTLEDWRGVVADVWKQNPSLDKAKIDNAIAEFHTLYDELFEKMNDARIANGYEPVDYRRGYFPHFQSGSDSKLAQFGRALGIDVEVNALPTTINGLTHTFKPGIRWFGNAQRRKGINTTYDAVEGFDRYIEGVADVIHQTENIQKLRSLATEIRYRTGDEGIKKQIDEVKAKTDIDDDQKHELIKEITEKGQFALSNFVVELDEYTNLLANKKSRHDRNFESDLGRRLYTVMKNVEGRVAANMVAVNPASWLTNFIPITQGWASLDTKNLLGGMLDTLKAYKVNDGIVERSSFLTNRRGSDPIVRTWAQSASNVASKPMEYIDQFTADTLVRARYKQNLNKGMSENAAMSEADAWTAGVMADRSKGALPTIFSRMNPVTKLFTQFQVEVNNQLGYLFKDLPRETKEGGARMLAEALLKFAVGAFIYNELYEYLIGRRPALDPIGIVKGGVEDALDKDLNGWEVAKSVGTEVIENLPFISGVVGGGRLPISSALPDVENLGKAIFNEDWDSGKRLKTIGKELSAPATYLALPFGGGQLKKIVQGVAALVKGGSYSTDSQGRDILQYPVYNDTTAQKIKSGAGAVIFGKSSLKTGRDWVESGFKSLGAAETEVYKQMTEAGVPDTEAWNIIQTFRSTKKTEDESAAQRKSRTLQASDISGAGKAVIYYGLLASEKETKLMDKLADSGADMGDVTDALINIKNAEDSNSKRYYIAEAALPDEVKQEIYTALVSDTHGDDIYRITTTGLDFNDYLFIQNKYSEINEKNLSAANKTLEFERWMDSEGFNARQEKAIQESFKFYSMTPAETENKYDELTELGISADKAESLVKQASIYDMSTTEDKLKFYRLAVSSVSSKQDRLNALTPWLSEGDLARCTYAYEAGIDPTVWVTYKEQIYGKTTQAQITNAINALVGVDNKQRAILWQMSNKGWKASNNPYSVQIGQQVYDFMHQED